MKMVKNLWLIVNFVALILCIGASLPDPMLHPDEVRALKEIGRTLGKNDWDFSKDPCGGEGNWTVPHSTEIFESNVTCYCSFAQKSTCYVVRIALKAQNLTGILPPEFAKLRHLTHLDLSRNLLNGSIPLEWATMRLVDMSLMDNRLSGPFPKIITGITSLVNLSLEGNMFSESIPSEIGQLINLQKLILSSNEFTRELPLALANLTSLTNLRISDNKFIGRIPDFISSWTHIEQLHIQGCSLDGPIPSSISALANLTDLRISDLAGGRSKFPVLSNLKSIKVLILRNCLLDGEIPAYIGNMKKLKILDLSFNNLTGKIPASFIHLKDVNFMFLTGNRLTGRVPRWVLASNKNVDLSSNNFTEYAYSITNCQQGNTNLVESYSSTANKLAQMWPCLMQEFPCLYLDYQVSSLHINCGGNQVRVDNTQYDADGDAIGASMFLYGQSSWAFSNTGNFLDDRLHSSDKYILGNRSALKNAPDHLYKTARVSPLSLTYYGICLYNGNYTVRLSFVEIVFTNETTFNNLGRRVFDVYIQGNLVLKDFNIADEAGGPGILIHKSFTVAVTSHTLKIHLYWAGRGTTSIPNTGTYGPLISAISVDPDFRPPRVHHKMEMEKSDLLFAIVVWIPAIVIIMIVACIAYRGMLDFCVSCA